jgi:D-3-phosphoglycerate dehydrogenase / 2-oxoglutarate reductase
MALVLSTHALHPDATELIERVAELRIAPSVAPKDLIRHGAGIDMIPVDAATAAGVLVANVPGANARSVAEYVMFAALALARRFRGNEHVLRSGRWTEARNAAPGTSEISHKVLGLIGLGHVGREILHLARAFDMSVIAFAPSNRARPEGVTMSTLDSVIAQADFLVLCCPLNDATTGLMNYARMRLMKPSAFLINVARGPIVIETDLLRALDEGTLAGAALDVFAKQPLPADHPFWSRDNLLLTPHVAGITQESMRRMGDGAAKETLRVLNNELPTNLINPAAVPLYRSRFRAAPR